MKTNTMALVAYITIIGWLVSYFQFKKSSDKDPFVNYHLAQSLGLNLIQFTLSLILAIIIMFVPALDIIATIIGLSYLILVISGIRNALQGLANPLPVIGKFFVGKYNFSKS